MNFFNFLGNSIFKRSKPQRRDVGTAWEDMLKFYGLKQPGNSGINVSETNATNLSSVYACVNVICQTVGTLPANTFKRVSEKERVKAKDHWLFPLLRYRPNPEQTASDFFELATAYMLLWGKAYIHIEWIVVGHKAKAFRVMHVPYVEEKRNKETGTLEYRVWIDNKWIPKPANEIMKVNYSYDGKSPVRKARDAIGLGKAAEVYGSSYFRNGAIPGFVVKIPSELSPQSEDDWLTAWAKKFGGAMKGNKVALLERGIEIEKIGVPPEDSQFLETRKFQVEEIARIFRVPLHKIQSMDKATFSNIEQQAIEFVTDTIRPILVQWEQAIGLHILNIVKDDGSYDDSVFVEFNVDAQLRGDIKSRSEALAIQRMWGIISQNEWRAIENMNPVDDASADEYLVPVNYMPAGTMPMLQEGRALEAPTEQAKLTPGHALAPSEPIFVVPFEEKRTSISDIITQRFKLRNRYMNLFEEAAHLVVNKEAKTIIYNAKKLLKDDNDVEKFERWMNEYYDNDFRTILNSKYVPVFASYGDSIFQQGSNEVGQDVDDIENKDDYVAEYTSAFGTRYIDSSRGQMTDVLHGTKVDEDGNIVDKHPEKLAAIIERVDQWTERRPDKVASNETTRMEGFIIIAAYAFFKVNYKWKTTGDNCPFCNKLNGQIVGTGGSFVDAGGEIDVGGETMKVYSGAMHPPVHQGCDCLIIPE